MNEILKINHLKKTYHTLEKETVAVKDFSMSLEEGEFIAIVGPSGCGKSTILSILSGLEEKTDGDIFLRDKQIGYMLQTDALFDWLTILDNCLLGLKIKGELTEEKKDYVKIKDNYNNNLDEVKDKLNKYEFIYEKQENEYYLKEIKKK